MILVRNVITIIAAAHIARTPALDPERITVTKQSTAVIPANQLVQRLFSFWKQRYNANGIKAACTAENPAGFSYVPVIGKA